MPRFYMDELGVELSNYIWRLLRPLRAKDQRPAAFRPSDVVDVLAGVSIAHGAAPPSRDAAASLPAQMSVGDVAAFVRSACPLSKSAEQRINELVETVFDASVTEMGQSSIEIQTAEPLPCRARPLAAAYREIAAVTAGFSGLSWSTDSLDRLAAVRACGPDRSPLDTAALRRAWRAGPLLTLGVRRGWWRAPRPLATVTVSRTALLRPRQGLRGVAVQYEWRGSGPRVCRLRVKGEAQYADVMEALRRTLRHLLPESHLEELCQQLIPEDSGDLDDEDVDISKPSYAAIYAKGKAALRDVDLQHCDEGVLEEYKQQMDADFKPLRPGDPGYSYRKSEKVTPVAASGWDDDDDDDF